MRAPLTPAAPPVPQDMPSPTMFAMAASIMDQHGRLAPLMGTIPHSDYNTGATFIKPAKPSEGAERFIDEAKRTHEDTNKLRNPDKRKDIAVY